MAKVMTDRAENDIKNKWYSMKRTEKRKKKSTGGMDDDSHFSDLDDTSSSVAGPQFDQDMVPDTAVSAFTGNDFDYRHIDNSEYEEDRKPVAL